MNADYMICKIWTNGVSPKSYRNVQIRIKRQEWCVESTRHWIPQGINHIHHKVIPVNYVSDIHPGKPRRATSKWQQNPPRSVSVTGKKNQDQGRSLHKFVHVTLGLHEHNIHVLCCHIRLSDVAAGKSQFYHMKETWTIRADIIRVSWSVLVELQAALASIATQS